jgi:hypothetical protein
MGLGNGGKLLLFEVACAKFRPHETLGCNLQAVA